MMIKKIIILILIILIPLKLIANYMWGWDAGYTVITLQSISASLSNLPGTTNIMIHKLRIQNPSDSTNDYNYPNNKAYPHLYSIAFKNIGALPSSNISAVHLWYDEDGTWNGNEKECNTAYECQSNVLFDDDYSPTVFGSVSDTAYFGPDLNIFVPGGESRYLYLVIDLSTNIIDNANIDTESVKYQTFLHCGGDWGIYLRKTNIINPPGQITTAVHATNLKIENEPTLVNIYERFSLTVSARDKYNNVDEDYTGSVYFMATNIHPTPYTPPVAFISNTNGNAYTFTAGDNGVHTFSTNAFKFLYAGVFQFMVSDGGTLNDDWSSQISASPEVHHFNISDQDDNNLSSFLITAGHSFKESGITNIKVSARNYVDAIIDNYQGDLYFILETPSSLYQNKIPYDNDSITLPTTSSTDKFAITNNGYQLIDADDFCIYNAGNNKLRVIDEFGFKGKVNLSIIPDAAYQFNIQSDTPLLSGEPFRFYIELTDKWNNVVDASDEIEITIFKNQSPFNDHTIPGSAVLEHGKKYYEKEDNIKIIEPGTYTIKIKDKDKTDITYEGTITVEMGAKNYLNIINNYVKPDEIKEVPIYYNNPYNEIVTINIKIFDIRGNLLKKFNPIEIPSGPSKADTWYLKNNSNNEVAPGIYIVQTEDSKGNKSRQMVVFVK